MMLIVKSDVDVVNTDQRSLYNSGFPVISIEPEPDNENNYMSKYRHGQSSL